MAEPAPIRYARGSDEFSRVLGFSDGIFAFAITLLVLGVAIPDPGTTGRPEASADIFALLAGLWPQLQAFVLSFVIVAYVWLGHHRLMASIGAIDMPLMVWNLGFLLVVVFLPAQSQLVGLYPTNPQALTVYALYFALLFLMDLLGLRLVWRRGLLREARPAAEMRQAMFAKLVPVGVFVGSVPVVWTLGVNAATLSWLAIWPLEAMVGRLGKDDGRPPPPG